MWQPFAVKVTAVQENREQKAQALSCGIDEREAVQLWYSRELPTMYCPQCGEQQLLERARFCFNCGFSLGPVRQLVPADSIMTETATATEPRQAGEVDSITFLVPTPIEEIEKGMIVATLKKTRDNKTRTAELLKISLKTLHNKLALYRESIR